MNNMNEINKLSYLQMQLIRLWNVDEQDITIVSPILFIFRRDPAEL